MSGRFYYKRPFAPAITISFIGSSNSNNAAGIVAPAGILAGDILVLFNYSANSGGLPAAVVPAGFTQIFSVQKDAATSVRARGIGSFKIAAGNESGTTITGMAGTSDRKILTVFRFTRSNPIINIVSPASELLDTPAPAAQNRVAGVGAAPLIMLAMYSANTTTAGQIAPVFTPAQDAELTVGVNHIVRYKIYSENPPDTSVSMADANNNNILASFYMQIT